MRTSLFMPPANGEGAAHQRPEAADGTITPDHEVGPAELILHLLVALLDPIAQAVSAPLPLKGPHGRLVVKYQVLDSGNLRRSVVMQMARTGRTGHS